MTHTWPLLLLIASSPWFVDRSSEWRLDFVHDSGVSERRLLPETMGAGGCVLDADGDGRLDLYLVQSGPPDRPGTVASVNRLYLQREGRFVPQDPGAASDRGIGQGAVCADVDGDGDTDLYVTNLGQNALYLNRGDATFEKAPASSGAPDPAWSTSASLTDFDGDLDLDLYVANYVQIDLASHPRCQRSRRSELSYCHPDVFAGAPDSLWENLGDGRFRTAADPPVTEKAGKGLGVVATDLDLDGTPELYVANDSTPNLLWRRRDRAWQETGLWDGVALDADGRTEAGMGVDAGDVDGDGRFDLVVTNLSLESHTLYLQEDDGFRDATRAVGLHAPSLPLLGFGAALVDLDLDGDLDLVAVHGDVLHDIAQINDALTWRQPGQLYLNDGRGHLALLDRERTGDLAEPRVGRALLLGDFDDDGDTDLVVTENGGPARFLENRILENGTLDEGALEDRPEGGDVEGQRAWVGLSLVGPHPNTTAIGALVEPMATGAAPARQLREVRAGSGYLGSRDPRLVFVVDPHASTRFRIRWPDGLEQQVGPFESGRYHQVRHPSRSALSARPPASDR